MTVAFPAIVGVFSLRSENRNTPTISAGPTRLSGVPTATKATAPVVVTATRSDGGQRFIWMTAKVT